MRTSTHAQFTTRRHPSLGPVLLLAFALLWAQALGLAHGIVHGPQLSSGHAVSQPSLADASGAGAAVADGFLAQLLAGHQGHPDCRVFEQLSHADVLPGVSSPALPALAPPPAAMDATASLFIRPILPFLARGPPLTR